MKKKINIHSKSGEIIRRTRAALGMSQKDLATLVVCSQANIAKYESGSIPDIQRGLLLAKALNLSLEYIFLNENIYDLAPDAVRESGAEYHILPAAKVDPSIQSVVDMMRKSNDEGRILAKNAVYEVLEKYRSRPDQQPSRGEKKQDILDAVAATNDPNLLSAILSLLPKSAATEPITEDISKHQ
jgi:transcriptional regulator with XRE-family HTH domain